MSISIDALILRTAFANHGACSRAELIKAGVTTSALSRRVHQGMLTRFDSSSYIVAGADSGFAALAASLRRFPDGVASDFSAARLFELPLQQPKNPQVLVPRGGRRRSNAVDVRETLHLPAYDIDEVNGLPTTSAARTLCDILPVLWGKRRILILDVALQRDLVSPDQIIACSNALARQGRAGTVARRELLETKLGQIGLSQSVLESHVVSLLDEYSIAGFVQQFRPPWFDGVSGIVDFAHPESKVIIEADGRTWHASAEAMRNDRARDRIAAQHGWQVIRVMWADVTQRPDEVAGAITTIIRRRDAA